MDRDPRVSPETTAQQRTASDPTIWADYFNLGGGVESNTGNCSGTAKSGRGSSYHCRCGWPVIIIVARLSLDLHP
jgi:hypothetical protein